MTVFLLVGLLMVVGPALAETTCFKFTGALTASQKLPAGSFVSVTWSTTEAVGSNRSVDGIWGDVALTVLLAQGKRLGVNNESAIALSIWDVTSARATGCCVGSAF
jgi:hypothetical protein